MDLSIYTGISLFRQISAEKAHKIKHKMTHRELMIRYRDTQIKTYDHKAMALTVEIKSTDTIC